MFFVCAFCVALQARKVEGRVHYSSWMLPGVIVTDGSNFTRTNADGTFTLDIKADAVYIYVVTPPGYTAPYPDGIPQFWQEVEGRHWFDFELEPSSPATDFTLFFIPVPRVADEEQLAAFESDYIPVLCDVAITSRIKGLTVAVANTDSVAKKYLPKVQKLLSKAKVKIYYTSEGPDNKAFYLGKDLVVYSRKPGADSREFAQNILNRMREDTYVFYPELFVNKWENAPVGFKVFSRSGNTVNHIYRSIATAGYPKDYQARFTLYESQVQSMEKEAMDAICSGVGSLEADLQLTRDGRVIILQDNYPRYPSQSVKLEARVFVERMEEFVRDAGFSPVHYTFAINSGSGAGEGKVWPEYKEFADKCLDVLLSLNLGDRLRIESFDDRVLNYIHKKYPQVKLCYLVDTECGSFKDYMSLLDFTPRWLGVQREMFDDALSALAREAGMEVLIWNDNNDN